MTRPTKPRVPTGLSTASRKLWNTVVTKYDLRADELRVLEDVCRTADLVDQLNAALAESPVMVKGSTGQPVVNPLVAEIRQHRATLATLMRHLKLPDDPAGASTSSGERSSQAREAANTRWSRRGA